MTPVVKTRLPRAMALLRWGWYGGLVTAAMAMLLVRGDPSAALVLAIILPVSLLLSPWSGVLASMLAAAGLASLAAFLSSQDGLDPVMRSSALAVVILAPAAWLAISIPAILRRPHTHVASRSPGRCDDQSSTICISDSTSRDTLGKVTPDTNRSRAA